MHPSQKKQAYDASRAPGFYLEDVVPCTATFALCLLLVPLWLWSSARPGDGADFYRWGLFGADFSVCRVELQPSNFRAGLQEEKTPKRGRPILTFCSMSRPI